MDKILYSLLIDLISTEGSRTRLFIYWSEMNTQRRREADRVFSTLALCYSPSCKLAPSKPSVSIIFSMVEMLPRLLLSPVHLLPLKTTAITSIASITQTYLLALLGSSSDSTMHCTKDWDWSRIWKNTAESLNTNIQHSPAVHQCQYMAQLIFIHRHRPPLTNT